MSNEIKEKLITDDSLIQISICLGTGGVAAGARDVFNSFAKELESNQVEAVIKERKCRHKVHQTGCRGLCALDVLVDVLVPGMAETSYARVTAAMVPEIVQEHIINKKPVEKYLVDEAHHRFFDKQKRRVLQRCGVIDPEDINDYLATDGYQALAKALRIGPEKVIDEVKTAGLRGRGGAGFPTGLKWAFCRAAEGDTKYLICNADEGDPGAFMDRSQLESDPHSVLEGIIIGSYAIGAEKAFIYVRSEYPLAIERLKIAIRQAKEKGYLGDNILNSGFNCRIEIEKGSGAFVCGEETALMSSIEGNRGMPKPRPPYPAEKGLWGKPTNINNVETLANVPLIILGGAAQYAQIGTEKSKGTKVFALTGKVNNTGLIEVPMGITIKEIVYDIGGGINNDKKFKAIQIGGPSGGCLGESHLDTPIDYDSLVAAGAIMGSGGCVVMDEDTCMVDIARYFMDFIQEESCGKCVPCRIGTKRMLEILTRICDGEGVAEDLQNLEELAKKVKNTALCGLGQTAPNPVESTFRYFKDEYLAHIKEKRCPAKACKNLIKYRVTPDDCKSCALCVKVCPSEAILGGKKGVKAEIQNDKCIRCGACLSKCPTKAIKVVDNDSAAAVEVK